MKKVMYPRIALFSLLVMLLFVLSASAGGGRRWAGGLRQHADHSVAEEIPFGNNDVSYGVAYEVYDSGGLWQFAVSLTPDVSERENVDTNNLMTVDQVITPELNLIMQDGPWLMGVGALMSYVEQENSEGEDETEWTDVYWQFMLGFQMPFTQSSKLKICAYYPFEDWGDIGDFEFDDLDFGGWVSFRF